MIIFQFYEHQNEHSRSHNRSTEGPIHPPASNDEDESNLEWCCISVTEYRLGWLLRVLHNINRGWGNIIAFSPISYMMTKLELE